jgi:hypothetical protein
MRIVTKPEELQNAVEARWLLMHKGEFIHVKCVCLLQACQREAKSSFGDSRVLIERYLPRPRHVELQVRRMGQ